MASTLLPRSLFMPKTISHQVLICKPYYRNNATRIRVALSSSKRPPRTRGSGQKINSTVSDNKDYSGRSNQKDDKKKEEKGPDATSEKTREAGEKGLVEVANGT